MCVCVCIHRGLSVCVWGCDVWIIILSAAWNWNSCDQLFWSTCNCSVWSEEYSIVLKILVWWYRFHLCIDQLLKESPCGNHDHVDINLSDDKDLKRLGILKHIYKYYLSISISSKLILSCCMIYGRPAMIWSFCLLLFFVIQVFWIQLQFLLSADWSWIINYLEENYCPCIYISQPKMDWIPKTLARTTEHTRVNVVYPMNAIHFHSQRKLNSHEELSIYLIKSWMIK